MEVPFRRKLGHETWKSVPFVGVTTCILSALGAFLTVSYSEYNLYHVLIGRCSNVQIGGIKHLHGRSTQQRPVGR